MSCASNRLLRTSAQTGRRDLTRQLEAGSTMGLHTDGLRERLGGTDDDVALLAVHLLPAGQEDRDG